MNARTINLDELNFLARRLDSFTDDEIEQFYAAVEQRNAKNLKDLINLTYNLDKFTIIKNVGDMTKVGREYTLNTEGCANADSRYDAKYAEIGRKLLASGRGVFTERGLLFVEDKPIEEAYDGKIFPGFAYQSFIVNVDVWSTRADLRACSCLNRSSQLIRLSAGSARSPLTTAS
nr:hypothetical protein [uncultured Ruminococcus sp.]